VIEVEMGVGEKSDEVEEIVKSVAEVEKKRFGGKLEKYRKKVEMVRSLKSVKEVRSMQMSDYEKIRLIYEMYVKLYLEGGKHGLGLADNLILLGSCTEAMIKSGTNKKSERNVLENIGLTCKVMVYTIQSKEKIKRLKVKDDEGFIQIANLINKQPVISISERTLNTNAWAIIIHNLFTQKEFEQLDVTLTDLNYITIPQSLGSIFNFYVLLVYYFRLKDETTTPDDYPGIMETMTSLISDIIQRIDNARIISFTYWIRGMAELHINQNIHALSEKKREVRGYFAKAALMSPGLAKEILNYLH